MERFAAKVWCWLLCIEIVALCSTGQAQAPAAESVAIFGVADVDAGGTHLLPVIQQVRAQLASDGRREVWVRDVTGGASTSWLAEAKVLGRTAFNQLATRAPEEVLRDYDERIASALSKVSLVRDIEGRSVLWNLCSLRVHLFLLTAKSPDEPGLRGAVRDCVQRFRDGPQLGKVWSPEVERAFAQYTADVRKVPLSVKTAPSGCELRLYGAAVGVTPTVVDVAPDAQEVQVVCEGRESAIHAIDVPQGRELVISLEADATFVARDNAEWLLYRSETDAARAVDHARVLAAEAQADSFVLVKSGHGQTASVEWVRLPASNIASGAVPLRGAQEDRAASIARIFRGSAEAGQADGSPSASRRRRRVWLDYAVGGGLLAAGAALSVAPLFAMAKEGECVDADCTSIHTSKGAVGVVMLTGAVALVAAGVTVLWVAPFGKRVSVNVGNGIALKGNF